MLIPICEVIRREFRVGDHEQILRVRLLAALVNPLFAMALDSDAELDAHRSRYSFYYERAQSLEGAAMDALYAHGFCLTLAVHGNRRHLPPEVLACLDKLTDVLERHFMETVEIIRAGPTFASLTESQRAVMEEGCLRIAFLE